MNTDNEQLLVSAIGDGHICVNGCKVGDAGQTVVRRRPSRARIFQAQLPKKPKDEGILRKNGTQKTMLIVKSDFGIEDAAQLLEQTTNA